MALPSKKRPKSEKRKRRAAHRLSRLTLTICSHCKKPVLPHHLCSFCGTYNGRELLTPKIIKKEKKLKKEQEKEKKK